MDAEERQAALQRMRAKFGLKTRREEPEPPQEEAEDAKHKKTRVDSADSADSLLLQESIVEEVQRSYAALLAGWEEAIMAAFRSFSADAKLLFVRLLSRKYRVFRVSTLNMSRMRAPSLDAAIRELEAAKFLTVVSELHLEGSQHRAKAFLRLAKVAELRVIAGTVGIVERQKMGRDQLVESLAMACDGTLVARSSSSTGQSTLSSFAAGHQRAASSVQRAASAVEQGLLKAFSSSAATNTKSPTLQPQQPSLLSMWGKKAPAKKTKETDDLDDDKKENQAQEPKCTVSRAFVGVALILSHDVCALFDRLEMLYFLGTSTLQMALASQAKQIRFPSYVPNRFGAPFETRQQMSDYVASTHLLHLFLTTAGMQVDWQGNLAIGDEVPIPGRPIRPTGLRDSFCYELLLLTAILLWDDGCIQADRDPAVGIESFEKSLEDELELRRKYLLDSGAPSSFRELMEQLTASDAAPLSVFEPDRGRDVVNAAADSPACVSSQLNHGSQLSQPHMRYLRRFRREYVLLYLVRYGIDFLEQTKHYADAVLLLRVMLALEPSIGKHMQRKIGYFWLRLSINCVHLFRDKKAAFAVALASLTREDELSVAAAMKLKQRVGMLGKTLKVDALPVYPILTQLKETVVHETIQGNLLTRRVGRKSYFEGVDGEGCSVEELVLQHYAVHGQWNGVHCEGRIWRTIWTLLMWELIFDSSVPYVFQTPFQSAPLDLRSPFFYSNRQDAIDSFAASIAGGAVRASDVLRQNYETHFGCQGPGTHWETYPLESLCQIVDACSGEALAQLLLYAARNYRGFGKGLPDLCLWKANAVLLCEVKGPRDRLSPEQEAHLLMLNRMGILAIVMHVKEAKREEVAASESSESEAEISSESSDGFK